MFQPRHRAGNLGVILLLFQMFNMGFDNIPPVTLALVVGQTAIFLQMFPKHFYSVASVCMSAYLVWERKDWKRMLTSQLYHADDMHLYFNMVSLLLKGRTLERHFGGVYFVFMVTVFTALTGMAYVALNLIFRLHNDFYATQCAVGFSGVLFAMKVVTTHLWPPGTHMAFGIVPIPSRYIYWAELVLIQLITPNASFTGHLAGILVGLLFIVGPLKPAMDLFLSPATELTSRGMGRTSGRRRGQRDNSDSDYEGWNRDPVNYRRYTGGLSEEDQYRQAMHNSYRDRASRSHQGKYPDLAELRDKRAARYK